jgi:histidinol-phosphate phosphatase family protein
MAMSKRAGASARPGTDAGPAAAAVRRRAIPRAAGGVPAVFLDKDGTLLRDVPFNVDPQRMTLMPGVASGLRALFDAGYKLCVVSNQPGVALGLFARSALAAVEARLDELAAEAGAAIDGYFWCPHAPSRPGSTGKLACLCRKPMPGLLLEAARRLHIDLARSWMIGDILDDIEAGHRAGCRGLLVNAGGETRWEQGAHREPDAMVSRFDLAVRFILVADATAHGDGTRDAGQGA